MNRTCPDPCEAPPPLAPPPSADPPSPVPPASPVRPAGGGRSSAPLWLVLTAFAAVYLIWGSTYLGIRLAIDTMPPFLMAGSRFLIAGGLLYGVMRWRGAARPEAAHWKGAGIIGALLLLAGNGGVTWAEQTVPTGLTALLIAITPLWILLADWLRPHGKAPGWVTVLGLAVGFGGVSLIVLGRNDIGQRLVDPVGAVVLLGATMAWAAGSIYARHTARPASALLAIAMQMILGGTWQILAGLLLGEGADFDPARLTATSLWAWAYLTFIGSLVGFTAYVWLLEVSTPARVSTYAYVNPLVAVLLGHLVLGEAVPPTVAMAGASILAAVILITRRTGK